MEFGFICIDWDNKALNELGKELLNAGFTWMEIHYPKYSNGDAFFEEYVETIRDLAQRYHPHLSFHLPAGDLNPASTNLGIRQESLRQINEAIDFGAQMGAGLAVMHPGELREADFPDGGGEVTYESVRNSIARALEGAWKLNIDAVAECAARAEHKGMKLTVENLFIPQTLLKTPEQMRRFLGDVRNKNVYCTVDVGHAFRAGLEPADFIKQLGENVIHLHLNDNDGSCDLHLPLGKGSIDFVPLLRELVKVDYRGAIILEITSVDASDFIESRGVLKKLLQ
jgi:sugar phosphate isomerase/epimerase